MRNRIRTIALDPRSPILLYPVMLAAVLTLLALTA